MSFIYLLQSRLPAKSALEISNVPMVVAMKGLYRLNHEGRWALDSGR